MVIIVGRALLLTLQTALLTATAALCASAQMSQKQAAEWISTNNGVINAIAMKKVLTASSAMLGVCIQAHDRVLSGYAISEAARRRNPALVPALAARMGNTGEAELSAAAARALGAVSGEQARFALRRGIHDYRLDVRTAAGVALAARGDHAAIPSLREALNLHAVRAVRQGVDGPDVRQRIAAATYLSIFQDRFSIPQIVRLTDELYTGERRLLCSPLARFGGPVCEQKLREMVAHESYSGTRAHAALALGMPGNRAAVTVLISALADPSPDVRWAAAQSLEAIGDRRAIPALKRAAMETSRQAANTPQMEAFAHVAETEAAAALSRMTTAGAAPSYKPIVDEGEWERAHPRVRYGYDRPTFIRHRPTAAISRPGKPGFPH